MLTILSHIDIISIRQLN